MLINENVVLNNIQSHIKNEFHPHINNGLVFFGFFTLSSEESIYGLNVRKTHFFIPFS